VGAFKEVTMILVIPEMNKISLSSVVPKFLNIEVF